MKWLHKQYRRLLKSKSDQFLQPAEALLFMGKGVRISLPFPPNSFRYWTRFVFRHGKTPPSACPTTDFTEQIIWYCPDNQSPRLLWCNHLEEWYEVYFQPIQKP